MDACGHQAADITAKAFFARSEGGDAGVNPKK
jgi:hypothetical protein